MRWSGSCSCSGPSTCSGPRHPLCPHAGPFLPAREDVPTKLGASLDAVRTPARLCKPPPRSASAGPGLGQAWGCPSRHDVYFPAQRLRPEPSGRPAALGAQAALQGLVDRLSLNYGLFRVHQFSCNVHILYNLYFFFYESCLYYHSENPISRPEVMQIEPHVFL